MAVLRLKWFFVLGVLMTVIVLYNILHSTPKQCPVCTVAHASCPSAAGGVASCPAPLPCETNMPAFAQAFDQLPWERMRQERERDGMYSGKSLEDYLGILGAYLNAGSKLDLPIVTKRPVKLSVDCGKYSQVLTGAKRAKPVKIFDLIILGYELDLLEARLYELDDAVDLFVILESSRAHRGYRKPLFFQENRERFAGFLHKIMYLVVDDGDVWQFRQKLDEPDGKIERKNSVPEKWGIELYQRKTLYNRFVRAYGFGNVAVDDLLVHGDLDEIPDGDVLYQMKFCETKLPAGFCPQVYTNHMRFPARSRSPEACFKPSVFNKAHVEESKAKEVLYRYKPPNRINAGMHATICGSLALQLSKYLSIAEPVYQAGRMAGLPASTIQELPMRLGESAWWRHRRSTRSARSASS